MKYTTSFSPARNGGVMTRIDRRISFPERRGPQPKPGETWEVEIAGTNPRGTVNFLRCIRRVEYCRACGRFESPQHVQEHAARLKAEAARRKDKEERVRLAIEAALDALKVDDLNARESLAYSARRAVEVDKMPVGDISQYIAGEAESVLAALREQRAEDERIARAPKLSVAQVLAALKSGADITITGDWFYRKPVKIEFDGELVAEYSDGLPDEFFGLGRLSEGETPSPAFFRGIGWAELADDLESLAKASFPIPSTSQVEEWNWEGSALKASGLMGAGKMALTKAQAEGLVLAIDHPAMVDYAAFEKAVVELRAAEKERERAEATSARVRFLVDRLIAHAGGRPEVKKGIWEGEETREVQVEGLGLVKMTHSVWYDTGWEYTAPSSDGYRPGGWGRTGARGSFGSFLIEVDGEEVFHSWWDAEKALPLLEAVWERLQAASPDCAVNRGETLDEARTRLNSAARYADASSVPEILVDGQPVEWDWDEAYVGVVAADIHWRQALVDPDDNVVVWLDGTINNYFSRSGEYIHIRPQGWGVDDELAAINHDPRCLRVVWRKEDFCWDRGAPGL